MTYPNVLDSPPGLLHGHINHTHDLVPEPEQLRSLPTQEESAPFEEQKGERATRISRHLRLSSRHRSVSPSARSRHHHSSSSLENPGDVSFTESLKAIDIARSDIAMLDNVPQTPPSKPLSIHSPRPVLSPQQSYSTEYQNAEHSLGVGGSSPRSERVVELEKMVEQTTRPIFYDEHDRPDDAEEIFIPNERISAIENLIEDRLPVAAPPSSKFSARIQKLPTAMEIFNDVKPSSKSLIPESTVEPPSRSSLVPLGLISKGPQDPGGLTLLERRLWRASSPRPTVVPSGNASGAGVLEPPNKDLREIGGVNRSDPSPPSAHHFKPAMPPSSTAPKFKLQGAQLSTRDLTKGALEVRRTVEHEPKAEAKGRVVTWLSQEAVDHDSDNMKTNLPPSSELGYGAFLTVEPPPIRKPSPRLSPRALKFDLPNLDASPPRSLLKDKEDLVKPPPGDEPLTKTTTTVAISSPPLISSRNQSLHTELTLNHLASRPDLSKVNDS